MSGITSASPLAPPLSPRIQEICTKSRELPPAIEIFSQAADAFHRFSLQMKEKKSPSIDDVLQWCQLQEQAFAAKKTCDQIRYIVRGKTFDFLIDGGNLKRLAENLHPDNPQDQYDYMRDVTKVLNDL